MRRTGEVETSPGGLLQLGLLEKSDPSLIVSQFTPRASIKNIPATNAPYSTQANTSSTVNSSNSGGSGSGSGNSNQYKLDHKGDDSVLEYGFVSRTIINSIKDKDWRVRSDGIEKFFELVMQLPSSPPAVLPHMPNLIRFLSKLLFDPNFTICLTSIRLIGELLPKLQNHIKPTLSFFLPNLVEKFGDSKIIIRQETMKVVTKLMQIVSPSSVIEVIKACYDEKTPNIQQHLLIMVIKAFLSFKDHQFDYPSIVPMLLSALTSPKVKVKQAGIEALVLVNFNMEAHTASLLEPIMENLDAETVKMLHRRFDRGQLPILGADGSVEFRIGTDGSVTDEFFDPSLSNSPAPSPAPSRIHTPMTNSPLTISSTGDELGTPDLKPNRHWSAGAKGTVAQAKIPPWFPISPSPSSPGSPMLTPSGSPGSSPSTPTYTNSTDDPFHSTDIRRSIFQRTRSLSLSDKAYLAGSDENTIFNLRNNPITVSSSTTTTTTNSGGILNLPPIGAGLASTSRIAPTLGYSSPIDHPSPFFSPVALPNFEADGIRKRNRPPSPSLSTTTTSLHPNLRDTGYTPSFGKKGSGGMPHPSAMYPTHPIDLDTPISSYPPNNDPTHYYSSNYSNNTNANNMTLHNPNHSNINNNTIRKNALTVMTNFDDENHNINNTDAAQQQQQLHRARIWSTLKPSALATFPVANNDAPKRRLSGRIRRDSLNLSSESALADNATNVNSNYGILENMEDDLEFTTVTTATPSKSKHPKSATRKQMQAAHNSSPTITPSGPTDFVIDDKALQHVKSSPAPFSAPPTVVGPPRAVSVMSTGNRPKPRSGHSRHVSRDRDADGTISTPHSPAPSSSSGPRVVNTSPSDITPTELLHPFENPDAELKQAMEWFSNGEWYHQFEALTSIRILVAYHSRVIIQQVHPILSAVLAATNNLRSLVSRHALVCIGDLFKHVGKHIEPHLDEIMLKVLKKYNESNNFLEKELDRAMGLMLLNVGEARAVGVLLMSAGNKSIPVRVKVAFFLANLVDILGPRIWTMREADRVLGVVVQLIQESSAEARAQGRRALFLMHQSDNDEFDRVLKRQCNESQHRKCREVLDKIISCGDPVSLGTKKPSSAHQKGLPTRTKSASIYAPSFELSEKDSDDTLSYSHKPSAGSPHTNHKEKSPTPKETGHSTPSRDSPLKDNPPSPLKESSTHRGQESPLPREASKGSSTPTPINNNAAPELDTILSDLENADWRTRYNAIGLLVELSMKDGKVQVLLTARMVKIFDHFTPRLGDANSKVNLFALSSLKQMIPRFRNGLESVLGVLVPALIVNLAATKQEVRSLTQEVFDEVLAHTDSAVLVPHFTCGVSAHANPKVKVVLLQLLADLVGNVYESKSYVVVKHILPLAFKLLDEKKGELRTVNTKLLQSLFKAMGNALWENSNSFNLSKQEQTRLHEILIS